MEDGESALCFALGDGGVGARPSFCNWVSQEETTVQLTEKEKNEVVGIGLWQSCKIFIGEKRLTKVIWNL